MQSSADLTMYCCADMHYHVTHTCEQHADNPFDCPDLVIAQFEDGQFVLPVNDGGESGIAIRYCPWCSADLVAHASRR